MTTGSRYSSGCLKEARVLTLFLYQKEQAKKVSNRLTQSKAFHRLVDWAYGVCDTKKTNHISSEQLYSGLLLVHLNLARFCGSAACMVSKCL